MSDTPVTSYEEFWPHYVRAHSKRSTRIIHAVGTMAFLSTMAALAITRKKRFLALAPVAGYGPAWFSHFFVEGNVPATFGNPLWSLRADFEMCWKMFNGTMDAEVERCVAEATKAGETTANAHPTNGHANHDHGSNGHGEGATSSAAQPSHDRPLN